MSSVYVVCWIFLQTFKTYFCIQANSVDPDQTAPKEAVWSGSLLFAKMTFKITSRWQSRQQLLWLALLRVKFKQTHGLLFQKDFQGLLNAPWDFTAELNYQLKWSDCTEAGTDNNLDQQILNSLVLAGANLPLPGHVHKQFITKTCLFKYTEKLITEKLKIFRQKKIFFIFLLKT